MELGFSELIARRPPPIRPPEPPPPACPPHTPTSHQHSWIFPLLWLSSVSSPLIRAESVKKSSNQAEYGFGSPDLGGSWWWRCSQMCCWRQEPSSPGLPSGLWDHQCGGEDCKVATQPESSRDLRPLRTGPRGTCRPSAQRECHSPEEAGHFSVVRGATQVTPNFQINSQHCPPPPPPHSFSPLLPHHFQNSFLGNTFLAWGSPGQWLSSLLG